MKTSCLLLLAAVVIVVTSAPTTTESSCYPQNAECDPALAGFRGGEKPCCADFQGCVRQSEPTDTDTGYRCTPIFVGR